MYSYSRFPGVTPKRSQSSRKAQFTSGLEHSVACKIIALVLLSGVEGRSLGIAQDLLLIQSHAEQTAVLRHAMIVSRMQDFRPSLLRLFKRRFCKMRFKVSATVEDAEDLDLFFANEK
jgi:hypothetical protein